jgi:hypothetical protein
VRASIPAALPRSIAILAATDFVEERRHQQNARNTYGGQAYGEAGGARTGHDQDNRAEQQDQQRGERMGHDRSAHT